jgi:hypothetical protein
MRRPLAPDAFLSDPYLEAALFEGAAFFEVDAAATNYL